MAIWQEYFENAYLSCFHYLANNKLHWTERIFWLIAILASFGGTYFVVTRNLFDYTTQKPRYRVDTNYLDWDVPYPSVVFCELRPNTLAMTQKKIVDKFLQEQGIDKSVIDEEYRSKVNEFAFQRSFDKALKIYCTKQPCPMGNFSVYMEKIRKNCTDFFTYCSYNNQVFDCCEEFLPVYTGYGKCFGFNNYAGRYIDGTRVKNVKRRIERKPEQPEGLLYIELKYSVLTINVLSPLEVPHIKNENTMIKQQQAASLKENSEYYYRVNLKVTVTFDDQKLVPIEARGCRFPDENNLHYFDFYSESNCILECLMLAQKKKCGCILHTYPAPPSEHCLLEGIFCSFPAAADTDCHCTPDCNRTAIQKVGATEKLARNFVLNSSTISLKVDIPAPTSRFIRYSLKTPLSLIVNIGGALGFFLGLSFLSLAQIFHYVFVRSLNDSLREKEERKRRDKENMMDESFRVARMRLKLDDVERDIRNGTIEKIKASLSNEMH